MKYRAERRVVSYEILEFEAPTAAEAQQIVVERIRDEEGWTRKEEGTSYSFANCFRLNDAGEPIGGWGNVTP